MHQYSIRLHNLGNWLILHILSRKSWYSMQTKSWWWTVPKICVYLISWFYSNCENWKFDACEIYTFYSSVDRCKIMLSASSRCKLMLLTICVCAVAFIQLWGHILAGEWCWCCKDLGRCKMRSPALSTWLDLCACQAVLWTMLSSLARKVVVQRLVNHQEDELPHSCGRHTDWHMDARM